MPQSFLTDLIEIVLLTVRVTGVALAAATLLGGWRGRPAGDASAAGHVVARLSEFVADFREEIAEVEINPLAVFERGVIALDCVIVPRSAP